jgi:hypothetical protein
MEDPEKEEMRILEGNVRVNHSVYGLNPYPRSKFGSRITVKLIKPWQRLVATYTIMALFETEKERKIDKYPEIEVRFSLLILRF